MIPPEAELTILGNMPVYWELIESMCTVPVLQNVTQKHMGKKIFFLFQVIHNCKNPKDDLTQSYPLCP